MIEYIDNLIGLSEWKTKRDIIIQMREHNIEIDERLFRKYVSIHNKRYANHEVDTYCVHSSRGYMLTRNVEDIRWSIADNKKRAIDLLIKCSESSKAIGENFNFSMYEIVGEQENG